MEFVISNISFEIDRRTTRGTLIKLDSIRIKIGNNFVKTIKHFEPNERGNLVCAIDDTVTISDPDLTRLCCKVTTKEKSTNATSCFPKSWFPEYDYTDSWFSLDILDDDDLNNKHVDDHNQNTRMICDVRVVKSSKYMPETPHCEMLRIVNVDMNTLAKKIIKLFNYESDTVSSDAVTYKAVPNDVKLYVDYIKLNCYYGNKRNGTLYVQYTSNKKSVNDVKIIHDSSEFFTHHVYQEYQMDDY